MAQIRRSELPPLRDPRTLGNRHKRNVPDLPVRKNSNPARIPSSGNNSHTKNNDNSKQIGNKSHANSSPVQPVNKNIQNNVQTKSQQRKTTEKIISPTVNRVESSKREKNVTSVSSKASSKKEPNIALKKPVKVNDAQAVLPKDTTNKNPLSLPKKSSTAVRESINKNTIVEKSPKDIVSSKVNTGKVHTEPPKKYDNDEIVDDNKKENIGDNKVHVAEIDTTESPNKISLFGKIKKKRTKKNLPEEQNDNISMDTTNDVSQENVSLVQYNSRIDPPSEEPVIKQHPKREEIKRNKPKEDSAQQSAYRKYDVNYNPKDDTVNSSDENSKNTESSSVENEDLTINNGKIIVPKNNIDTRKRKKPIFMIFINIWIFLIAVSIIALTAFGFVWWNNVSLEKEKSIAYQNGYSNAYDQPNVENIVRNTPEETNNLILSTPGNGYPSNAILSDHTLVGWSTPGGNEGHGRANLSVCYTGDGVGNPLQSYVYLVSDNSGSQHPTWYVDSIDVTGDPCHDSKDKGF